MLLLQHHDRHEQSNVKGNADAAHRITGINNPHLGARRHAPRMHDGFPEGALILFFLL